MRFYEHVLIVVENNQEGAELIYEQQKMLTNIRFVLHKWSKNEPWSTNEPLKNAGLTNTIIDNTHRAILP